MDLSVIEEYERLYSPAWPMYAVGIIAAVCACLASWALLNESTAVSVASAIVATVNRGVAGWLIYRFRQELKEHGLHGARLAKSDIARKKQQQEIRATAFGVICYGEAIAFVALCWLFLRIVLEAG